MLTWVECREHEYERDTHSCSTSVLKNVILVSLKKEVVNEMLNAGMGEIRPC